MNQASAVLKSITLRRKMSPLARILVRDVTKRAFAANAKAARACISRDLFVALEQRILDRAGGGSPALNEFKDLKERAREAANVFTPTGRAVNCTPKMMGLTRS